MGEYVVERSVDVAATPLAVWTQLTDVKSWPEWKPFVQSVRMRGYDTLTAGTRFTMALKAGGPVAVPLTVAIRDFDRPHVLSWEGGLPGVLKAVHSFTLEDRGGRTRVTTREVFTGAALWLALRLVTKEDIEELHDQWLSAIKSRMEGPAEPAEGHAGGHSH